jgi:hypothetical protein
MNFPWRSPTKNSELCNLLVPIHSLACFHRCYFSRNSMNSEFSASLGTLLTYIAKGRTSTNRKHISHDPYPQLLCDVTTHAQADRHAGNTCHVMATYCWCVTSLLLRQLALLLRARVMFTEALHGNGLHNPTVSTAVRDGQHRNHSLLYCWVN